MILYADENRSPKKIYIKESSILALEGIDWSVLDNGAISMSVNQKKDDNSNKGGNSVDTRVFGTKDDILNGKILGKSGLPLGSSKSLEQDYSSKKGAIEAYKRVMNWVQGGRVGSLDLPSGLDKKTTTTINKWIDSSYSDNRIIDACKKAITRITPEYNRLSLTHDRVSSSENDKVARYITGIVPDTDVKYISLFSMTDFNFSDAIKHGKIRQNGNTDALLGIDKDSREKDANGNLKTLDIVYDKSVVPNVAQNFSLNGVSGGHFKQQFGLNGEGGYSSVSQFLDKSVNYAAYALKKEEFMPRFIVSAPSSSKFNKYYCTNLANKLGVTYMDDFFKRNVINVRYADGKDLLSKGFSEKDVFEFESQARNVAYNEIAYLVSEPIRNIIYGNEDIFSNISLEKHSREKISLDDVFDCTMIYTYNTILETLDDDDIVQSHIVKNFLKERKKLYAKSYDSTRIFSEVSFRIRMKIGIKVFNKALLDVRELVLKYSDKLKTNGYKLRFNLKRFKITSFKKMFRPFLSNLYVIADEYMTDGQLMNRFKNENFLIFDEDINSGATLKIVIDALEEKLPDQSSDKIMCLVNAFSNSGF